jgi:hypothetical protein
VLQIFNTLEKQIDSKYMKREEKKKKMKKKNVLKKKV